MNTSLDRTMRNEPAEMLKQSVSPAFAKPDGRRVRLTAEQHRRHIAITAYYLAERRGFVPGQEKSDWLLAEHHVVSKFGIPVT